MTAQELEFNDKCPAWARKAGITDLFQWRIAEALVSLPWANRFDKLDEMRYVVIKALEKWDDDKAPNQ